MKTISEMSFEEAYAELDMIVKKMDLGEVNLAASVELYERAMQLKKHLENILNEAKLKIEKIDFNKGDTNPTLTPFE